MGRHAGSLALVLILALVGSGLAGLLLAADPASGGLPWAYVRRVATFTVGQAAASTVLSIAAGAAIALALARRPAFAGRRTLIAAMNLASVLPAIVAAFGILAVFGRSGWVGEGARAIGLELGAWVYGLPGILIAHVFFNAPLAARIFLAGLEAVPGERLRLAAQLGMGAGSLLRLVDFPVFRREAPGVASLIFLLCFTSFAIVLTLGGGPAASTLEVAIYEAVRFEADFGRAGLLALIQIAIGLAFVLPFASLKFRPAEAPSTGLAYGRPRAGRFGRLLDGTALVGAALLVLPPLAATVAAGLWALPSLLEGTVFRAVATSALIALPAAAVALGLALALAAASVRLRARGRAGLALLYTMPGVAVLAVPPIALSAGLFVVVRLVAEPFGLAIPLIVLVNAVMALPFVLRQVEPPLALAGERYGRLAESLGIAGTRRLRLVAWPLLKGPAVVAFMVAGALSFGDLGVAAFFGGGRIETLPLLLSERMGAYRMAEAASVALLLAAIVLVMFLAAQRFSEAPIAKSR